MQNIFSYPQEIWGTSNHDSIEGGALRDLLGGNEGNDTIRGKGDHDTIWGWTGNDLLFGDDGNDIVGGDHGDDSVHGGSGNDQLWGWDGNDLLQGDDGNDTLEGGEGSDALYGGAGKDRLIGNGYDIVLGDAGNDRLDASAGDGYNSLMGGEGADRLFGTTYDVMHGGDGDDYLVSFGAGYNSLHGDDGNDVLRSNADYDYLDGGSGDDIFHLSGVHSTVVGGSGDDILYLQGIRSDYQFQELNGITTLIAGEETHSITDVERFIFSDDTHTDRFGTTIPTASNAPDNMVIHWISAGLNCVSDTITNPLYATRALAIQSLAMRDAVMGLDDLSAKNAAAAQAAHDVLAELFPAIRANIAEELQQSLSRISDGTAKSEGIAYGSSVAATLLAQRATDGWDAVIPWEAGDDVGYWQPTPPAFRAPLAPHWGEVRPFILERGDQFRPDGFPAWDSPEYAVEFNEVKDLGRVDSLLRTADQTEIARFWADGPGTHTPGGHWNAITAELLAQDRTSIDHAANIFATLNVALADAGIAAWDAKYAYDSWRPVTAIVRAAEDGNPLTEADASWMPLIITPPFPEYVSGHSTFSATAATVLTELLGAVSFQSQSMGLLGVIREFEHFMDAASEAGMSRIYGGIHFQSGNLDGQELGHNIGAMALDLGWV
ncbi:MAG: phosphatase PAP2 family protein [Alphaproteobacteria bacterium]|nr:MAG: phosphatase PAP2 family protein [Alphaproteobacteria bacterium]